MTALLLVVGLAHAHKGHTGDPAPWAACEDRTVGEACSFTKPNNDLHRGTCRQIADHAMCVRNQPVVFAADATSHTSLWMGASLGLLMLVGAGATLRQVDGCGAGLSANT